MARRTRLGAALSDTDDPTTTPAPHEDASGDPPPQTTTDSGQAATKKASPRKKRGPSSQTASRKQPAKATAPAKKTEPAHPEPQVLGIDTRSAKRQTIYLHPDDHRALAQGRIDDGADANARVRAMIAVWRTNPRYRTLVDRLARTAPRGGG